MKTIPIIGKFFVVMLAFGIFTLSVATYIGSQISKIDSSYSALMSSNVRAAVSASHASRSLQTARASEAMKTIGSYIVTLNQHMDTIAKSAREQSLGLAEVNTAVNQMDQVTQQNAAMVEETNAASATLAGESTRLWELINQFQLAGNVSS